MTERERDLRAILSRSVKAEAAGVGLDDDLMQALGLDSLAALRLLAAVEKHFRIRFPDERLGDLRTLRMILDALAKETTP